MEFRTEGGRIGCASSGRVDSFDGSSDLDFDFGVAMALKPSEINEVDSDSAIEAMPVTLNTVLRERSPSYSEKKIRMEQRRGRNKVYNRETSLSLMIML